MFLNAETTCTVAALSSDELLLLDGRWLPGTEGGVLLKGECPVALLAAPLRGATGSRWSLCPAVPLRGVAGWPFTRYVSEHIAS